VKCYFLLLDSVLLIAYYSLSGEGRNICVEPSYLNLAERLTAIKSPLQGLLHLTFIFVKVMILV